MRRRLTGLMRKEFLQFIRDRALVILVLYTFIEIAICGWALTLEVRNMPALVYDADRSAESRALARSFGRLENFEVIAEVADPSAVYSLMESGKIQVALIVPEDFGRQVKTGTPAQVQVLVDGSNSSLAAQATAILSGLLRQYNANLEIHNSSRSSWISALSLPRIRNLVQVWYMPQLKYVHFVMLTMLTISVLVLGVLLPAASLVREKEAGTFEQLMVTPVRGYEVILAKTLPMIIMKTIGLTIGAAMSLWLFDVPLRGSILLFYAISLLMFLSSMGIGVLIGAFAQNMQQTLLIGFFIFFPVAFLSGTMVPVNNMPIAMQWLTYLSPLRYYVEATLGIFLKGVGITVLWPQTLALGIFGAVLLSAGVLQLRRSLV